MSNIYDPNYETDENEEQVGVWNGAQVVLDFRMSAERVAEEAPPYYGFDWVDLDEVGLVVRHHDLDVASKVQHVLLNGMYVTESGLAQSVQEILKEEFPIHTVTIPKAGASTENNAETPNNTEAPENNAETPEKKLYTSKSWLSYMYVPQPEVTGAEVNDPYGEYRCDTIQLIMKVRSNEIVSPGKQAMIYFEVPDNMTLKIGEESFTSSNRTKSFVLTNMNDLNVSIEFNGTSLLPGDTSPDGLSIKVRDRKEEGTIVGELGIFANKMITQSVMVLPCVDRTLPEYTESRNPQKKINDAAEEIRSEFTGGKNNRELKKIQDKLNQTFHQAAIHIDLIVPDAEYITYDPSQMPLENSARVRIANGCINPIIKNHQIMVPDAFSTKMVENPDVKSARDEGRIVEEDDPASPTGFVLIREKESVIDFDWAKEFIKKFNHEWKLLRSGEGSGSILFTPQESSSLLHNGMYMFLFDTNALRVIEKAVRGVRNQVFDSFEGIAELGENNTTIFKQYRTDGGTIAHELAHNLNCIHTFRDETSISQISQYQQNKQDVFTALYERVHYTELNPYLAKKGMTPSDFSGKTVDEKTQILLDYYRINRIEISDDINNNMATINASRRDIVRFLYQRTNTNNVMDYECDNNYFFKWQILTMRSNTKS